MSDKVNIVVRERILAFKLSQELKPEDWKLVSGAGMTHGLVTAPTGPGDSYDRNEYVFDYD